jgi:hypothetical protein
MGGEREYGMVWYGIVYTPLQLQYGVQTIIISVLILKKG